MQSGDGAYQFLQSPVHLDMLMWTNVTDGEIQPSCSSSSSPQLAELQASPLHSLYIVLTSAWGSLDWKKGLLLGEELSGGLWIPNHLQEYVPNRQSLLSPDAPANQFRKKSAHITLTRQCQWPRSRCWMWDHRWSLLSGYSMPTLEMQPNHLDKIQAKLVARVPLQLNSDGISMAGDDKDSP